MRILHTSDWHVGRTIRGRSRDHEHRVVLSEIAEIAAGEAVDLVLVVGDLFDTAAPTPAAERIVYRALLDLADTGATVVVVAGNHDNERRLQAVEPLLGLGKVVVQPMLAAPDAGGVIDVGEARIALLPFLSHRWIVRADELMTLDADQHAGRYAERLRQIVERLTAGFTPDKVNLVVAHLTATGGLIGGGERTAHIFGYDVSGAVFPAAAHYVALGHLHRPQRIAGPCPIWYSGSPLQLDFGETGDTKAVLLVEASPGVPATVREVPLQSGRRLRNLRGSLADLRQLAGTTGDDWLRVFVREPARAGLADEVRDLFPEAVDVVLESADEATGPSRREQRQGRSARELFGDYLAERDAVDERVLALFDELYEDAHAAHPA